MQLKVRYENKYQIIDLDQEATDNLWVSLSLEGEELSLEEKEQRIQEAWEISFNRPDYNCWHKQARHTDPCPKARRMDGKKGYLSLGDTQDFCVMDYLSVADFREEQGKRDENESLRQSIRSILKPDYAEMIIAIHLDGMKPGEYAEMIGEKPNTLNHRLQRAEKKLREMYQKMSF